MSSIPKVIHYCWFGGNPLSSSARKCIASWQNYLPNYEIREWNDSNYDVRKIPYISQAYDVKQYAFVSDYARFDVLYQFGGIYFDTDVEIIQSLDDILTNGPYMGCEIDGGEEKIMVNPGLGIAAQAGLPIFLDVLHHYGQALFLENDGSLDQTTVVTRVTEILEKHGLKNIAGKQHVGDITIYPREFFNPLNANTGKLEITSNTRSIHWYSKTWRTPCQRARGRITRVFHRLFGENCFSWIKKIINH